MEHVEHLDAEAPRRVVPYVDLSEFQRGMFDATGELHGIEVTDCQASAVLLPSMKDAAQ